MSIAFLHVRVGEAVRYQALTVFPLFDGSQAPIEYLLSDEGIGSGCVTVEEVSEAGSVPDLLVENKGDIRVLFIEGEELIGAKQNRILNTSLLIAAKTKTKIPVSCVEAGRWRSRSRHFDSSGSHSPSKLRYFLKSSVTRSLMAKRGYRSDQGKVWEEVARQQSSLGAVSGTSAMADTFETYRDRMEEFRQKLRYVEGASGIAVAIGKKIVTVDLFDKPATCRKVWDRIMSGYVLDALEAPTEESQAETADVEQLVRTANALEWQKADPVGEGDEYRAQRGEEVYASALTLNNSPVHLSVVVAV